MKTNRSARRRVRIRRFVFCLALAGSVGLALGLGAALATRAGQVTARQTESAQAPNVNLGELLASIR